MAQDFGAAGRPASHKGLKVVSILLIVLAVISIIAGLVGTFGGGWVLGSADIGAGATGDMTLTEDEATGILYLTAFAMVMLVSGIIDLVIGLLGLRASKNPAKTTAFLVLCVIGLLATVIGVIEGIVGGSFTVAQLVHPVLIALCLVWTVQWRKQA